MATELELAAMRRAIAISAFGLGGASPNPPVGCVVLNPAGAVAGEGYHERKGQPHAEANALAAAGAEAAGGTAVVTLEPCNHQGITPPCRQALIDARVRRVLVAVIDPTSRDRGGVAELRDAGVDVEVGALKDEALAVLGPWRLSLLQQRPTITWVYGIAADGRQVPAHQLAGAVGRDLQEQFAEHDAVLGDAAGTLREGRPGAHSPEQFRLPALGEDTTPVGWLASLAAGGVRTALVLGGDVGRDLLAAGLVDRVVVYVAHSPASRAPIAGAVGLPSGFSLTGVARLSDAVRVELERSAG